MKTLILSILFLFSLNSFAQSDTITAATAKNYIGKEVVLKGILKGVKPYSDRNGKDILFLDIDEAFPNSEIGITVFPDAVPEVKITKEDVGRTVFISGIVQDYKGKPSLPISEGKQFRFKE
jgi:DNA/RNA endonuclease YhcR with UshA esterase domain